MPFPDDKVTAARMFYCGVLGGRPVAPGRVPEALCFLVGRSRIETGPGFRNARSSVVLGAEEVDRLAMRCWDAGFSVYPHDHLVGEARVTLVDPFGRRIDLIPSTCSRRWWAITGAPELTR